MTARFDDDEDFTLVAEPRPSARARRGSGGGRRAAPRRWAWLSFLTRRPGRTIMGAVVSAILTCIVINALVLQKAKHPAPLFMPAQVPQAAPARPAIAAPVHLAPPVPDNAPVEAKPKDAITTFLKPNTAEKPTFAVAPSAAKPKDPIAALLKENAAERPRAASEPAEAKPKDAIGALIKSNASTTEAPSETVAAAQQALVRLGFVLRADGVPGAATRQAIELFERDHGMQVNGDLSPRVIKQLSALSGVAIH
jgi:hypothetical protein